MQGRTPKLIQAKDKANGVSSVLGDSFNALEQELRLAEISQLMSKADDSATLWNRWQLAQMMAFRNRVNKIITEGRKTILKEIRFATKELKFTAEQKQALISSVDLGITNLHSLTIQNHNAMVQQVTGETALKTIQTMQTPDALPLFEAIQNRVNANMPRYNVVYKNGKAYHWNAYMEMNVRTNINNEVVNNLVTAGDNMGQVFYVCSCYGDSRKQHAEIQEKGLFYSESWEAFDMDDATRSKIQDYIDGHKLMSIQSAMGEEGNYFTTSPNCRHYFEPIATDEVLKIENKDDLREYRSENNLLVNGSYDPDKYDALQQQRKNERMIRGWKDQKEQDATALQKAKDNNADPKIIASLQNRVDFDNHKLYGYTDSTGVKHEGWYGKQRELIANNNYLRRQYNREKSNKNPI